LDVVWSKSYAVVRGLGSVVVINMTVPEGIARRDVVVVVVVVDGKKRPNVTSRVEAKEAPPSSSCLVEGAISPVVGCRREVKKRRWY
jgi:hypothetical protein